MKKTACVFFLFVLFILQNGITKETESKATPWQAFENRLKIRITGLDRVKEWKMLPNIPSAPSIKSEIGYEFSVVKFEVRNISTGELDTSESFRDFEVEDLQGNKYGSALKATDLREIPFPIPEGTILKFFRIATLTFDIEELSTVSKRK